jgi:hypothetical protein
MRMDIASGTDRGNSARAALVGVIARDIVADVAPEEIAIFPAASAAYFDDPAAALKQSRSKGDVLGFGTSPLGLLLTPVILAAVAAVFDFLTAVAKKSVEDGLAKEVPELVRAMFRKFHAPTAPAPSVLTREQLAVIHGQVLMAATKLRVPADTAESLANAVIAQLVLPTG